jgi:hypothetical protein
MIRFFNRLHIFNHHSIALLAFFVFRTSRTSSRTAPSAINFPVRLYKYITASYHFCRRVLLLFLIKSQRECFVVVRYCHHSRWSPRTRLKRKITRKITTRNYLHRSSLKLKILTRQRTARGVKYLYRWGRKWVDCFKIVFGHLLK